MILLPDSDGIISGKFGKYKTGGTANEKKIAAFVSALLVTAAACPASAFALDSGIEKKTVKAYRFTMENSNDLECLFKEELPEVPYISAADYLSGIYKADFVTESDGDVYTVTGNEMTLTVDADKDTVIIKNFDSSVQNNAFSEDDDYEDDEDEKHYSDLSYSGIEGENKDAEFSLSDYSIDLIGEDGKIYFPLSTIADIFDISYNAAEYVDGNIYFVHSLSPESKEDGYFDRSSVYSNAERSQALADFTYNELCFLIDNLYARPSNALISESIIQKGLDKSLDEFNDTTRQAKQLLLSTNNLDYLLGLSLLTEAFDDGGHTVLPAFITEVEKYGGTPLISDYVKKMNDPEDPIGQKISETMTAVDKETFSASVTMLRDYKYLDLEMVKDWPGEEKTAFYTHGDTAYFVFDSFESDVIERFKWSLDYAQEKGIKNFVIDISANGGGDSDVLCYVNALITNKNKDSNSYTYYCKSFATGNIISKNLWIDLDLNGTVDDKDKEVYYDFNYAIITSEVSFSCGNLMPILAQKSGIPILGWNSGGGACMLVKHYNPASMFSFMSSIYELTMKDEPDRDIDKGVIPDFLLAELDEDNHADYTEFYDFAKIESFIDEFYKTEEQPADTDQSSGTPKSADTDRSPATGAPAMIALAAAACAAVLILVLRKKNKAE